MRLLENYVTFQILTPGDIKSSALVLSLLSAAASTAVTPSLVFERHSLSVAQIVSAAELFGIDAAAIRMALTRLTREGRVNSPSRGQYELGQGARPISSFISGWRTVADLKTQWTGAWWMVLTGHLGRGDRKALRQREIVLGRFGYAEAESGVWVRPANLKLSLSDFRDRMVQAGLPGNEVHLLVPELHAPDAGNWPNLWDRQALEAGYQAALETMRESQKTLEGLSPQDAARESFLVGQSVIRCIGLDPLLPMEMVDDTLFRRMHTAMVTYDTHGRQFWQNFFAKSAS